VAEHITELTAYYNARASEYEEIYHRQDPEQQAELARIAKQLDKLFLRLDIIDVACGTGYWTNMVAPDASHVTGIDLSEEMLSVARNGTKNHNVEYRLADAYDLGRWPAKFDGALVNFWLSHVPKSKLTDFLSGLHSKLSRNSIVFMADNVCVPGLGGELLEEEGREDTFKLRTLRNGTTHKVIKNYYDRHSLKVLFEPRSKDLDVWEGRFYWTIKYAVP